MKDDPDRLLKNGWHIAWLLIAAAITVAVACGFAITKPSDRWGQIWPIYGTAISQLVYVTLTFWLVVLTYRLFKMAVTATSQQERFHQVALLPVVTFEKVRADAEIGNDAEASGASLYVYAKLSFELHNVGGGPALDVRIYSGIAAGDEFDVKTGLFRRYELRGRAPEEQSVVAIEKDGTYYATADTSLEHQQMSHFCYASVDYKDIYGRVGHTTYVWELKHLIDPNGTERYVPFPVGLVEFQPPDHLAPMAPIAMSRVDRKLEASTAG